MWKVPVIVATGIICFVLGIGVGIGAFLLINKDWGMAKQENPPAQDMTSMYSGATNPGMIGPPGGGGGGGGGGRGGFGGGFGGPSPKVQLAALIGKLETLTTKPLTVKLTDEQKKKLAEQLQGLDDKEELTDEDAKARLDAILEIVKDDKATLEAAGYRWPGQGGGAGGRGGPGGGGRGGPPADVPNPFKEGDNNKHLKSLQEQVGKS